MPLMYILKDNPVDEVDGSTINNCTIVSSHAIPDNDWLIRQRGGYLDLKDVYIITPDLFTLRGLIKHKLKMVYTRLRWRLTKNKSIQDGFKYTAKLWKNKAYIN